MGVEEIKKLDQSVLGLNELHGISVVVSDARVADRIASHNRIVAEWLRARTDARLGSIVTGLRPRGHCRRLATQGVEWAAAHPNAIKVVRVEWQVGGGRWRPSSTAALPLLSTLILRCLSARNAGESSQSYAEQNRARLVKSHFNFP